MPTSASFSTGSSVFDRLYSKGTESSKHRKCVAPVTEKNFLSCHEDDKTTAKPRTKPMKKKTIPGGFGVHDRLYSKGTASYNCKKKAAGGEPSRTDPRGPLQAKTNA